MNEALSIFPNFGGGGAEIRRANAPALRAEVRDFITQERGRSAITLGKQSWTTYDRAFSERCAERGYIGMT